MKLTLALELEFDLPDAPDGCKWVAKSQVVVQLVRDGVPVGAIKHNDYGIFFVFVYGRRSDMPTESSVWMAAYRLFLELGYSSEALAMNVYGGTSD